MAYFNIGETDAGWLTSVFTIMGMITAIPASWLLRKFGAKKIGVISLLCAAVGSALGAFSTELWMLMATRVLEGVGVGMIAVVGPAIISMWFPAEKRGLPMGVWGSWQMASQTILFLVGGGLSSSFGWQGVWWFVFAMCVVALILYQWKVEEPHDGMPNYAEGEDEEEFHFGDGFKSSSTWILTLCGTIFTFCCFGFATYISLYWAQAFYGGDMSASNLWVSIMYAIEVPVVIFIGWLLNKVPLTKRRFVGVIGFALYTFILFFCFRMDAYSFDGEKARELWHGNRHSECWAEYWYIAWSSGYRFLYRELWLVGSNRSFGNRFYRRRSAVLLREDLLSRPF